MHSKSVIKTRYRGATVESSDIAARAYFTGGALIEEELGHVLESEREKTEIQFLLSYYHWVCSSSSCCCSVLVVAAASSLPRLRLLWRSSSSRRASAAAYSRTRSLASVELNATYSQEQQQRAATQQEQQHGGRLCCSVEERVSSRRRQQLQKGQACCCRERKEKQQVAVDFLVFIFTERESTSEVLFFFVALSHSR